MKHVLFFQALMTALLIVASYVLSGGVCYYLGFRDAMPYLYTMWGLSDMVAFVFVYIVVSMLLSLICLPKLHNIC